MNYERKDLNYERNARAGEVLMAERRILSDYDENELKTMLSEYGLKPFQAGQVYKWVIRGCDFDEMTDVSKALREKLSESFIARPVTVIKRLVGKDKTEKYLYGLTDGNVIEGVLMSYKYGRTLCVSTQVGCRMGCRVCASTLGGLVRNLSAGEILGQVIAVNRLIGGGLGEKRGITNIVLMGSGEPLDNYDNVVKFLRLCNAPEGMNVAMRNISLSTCGIVPNIRRLADENIQVTLTVSLHEAFDDKRKEIMPIAEKYSVSEIIDAARYYFDRTKRRIIFEYTLIEGKNDTPADAREIARILRGLPSHVNLIRLNPVKERNLRSVSSDKAAEFLKTLTDLKVSATLRRQMGVDIEGACGQLRRKHLESLENE